MYNPVIFRKFIVVWSSPQASFGTPPSSPKVSLCSSTVNPAPTTDPFSVPKNQSVHILSKNIPYHFLIHYFSFHWRHSEGLRAAWGEPGSFIFRLYNFIPYAISLPRLFPYWKWFSLLFGISGLFRIIFWYSQAHIKLARSRVKYNDLFEMFLCTHTK